MPIERSELRRVVGHFATGVTVVTTRDGDGKPHGFTANSVTSVSLAPPMILVCVDKNAETHSRIEQSKVFTVNVLSNEQEEISRRFATKGTAAEKFEGVAYREGANGCAVLSDVVAHLDCRIVASHDAGDHTIHVGEVDAADAVEQSPLLFFRGGYRKIEAA
jgi:flavin reductase (DIM6/NTAB) family NADH-FMN oxidoreductase RutF